MKIKSTTMKKKLFYLIAGLAICCFGIPDNAWADAATTDLLEIQGQTITVRGIVLDAADSSPLLGVAVVEVGSGRGVSTDIDGRFTLGVSPEAVLEFSYLGYERQRVTVGQSTDITVRLNRDAHMLENVVIEIGYGGFQRKQDLSMSISVVEVDNVARSRSSDLATVLQGKVPGMNIQMAGDPMKGSTINIRGRGSMGVDDDETNDSGVLIVVDGIPNAPYMIEDVATITVLKDAASSAIFGSQAGNGGVILITTKKASAGKSNVAVNISSGVKKVTNLPTMLTSEQFNMVWRQAAETKNPGAPDLSKLNFADPDSEVYSWTNVTRTDWLDEIFRIGTTQHYAVTVSGGSEKLTSIFSAAYDQEEGVIISTYKKTLSARLNTDYRIAKWLKFSQRVNYMTSIGQGDLPTGHGGALMSAFWMPRSATVYAIDPEGNYILDGKGDKKFGGLYPAELGNIPGYPKNVLNPVAELKESRRWYPENKLYSTSSLEIKPVNQFTFRSDFTAYRHNHDVDEIEPKRLEPGSYMRNQTTREQFFNRDFGWLWETTATFAEVFGKHHISAMAAYSMKYDMMHRSFMATEGYKFTQNNSLLWDHSTKVATGLEEWIYAYASNSLIGRVGYSYDDRYFMTASMRYDGSSKLPANNRYQAFPAVSASWKFTSEPFMRNQRAFDLIKFRGSWGRLGDVAGLKAHESVVTPINNSYYAIFGRNRDKQFYGSYYKTMANKNLVWEYTDQLSAGVDIALFKNRLEFSVDYYEKATKNLIAQMALADQIGIATAPNDNIGVVRNTGWEFSLNLSDRTTGGFGYSLWGILNKNTNVVSNLGQWVTPIENSWVNVNSNKLIASQVGHPLHSYYLRRTDGIFRTQEEIDNYLNAEGKKLQPDAKPGDIKFIDVDGNGKIEKDDRVLCGSYMPKFNYSFGGSLELGGFDLSFMFQGVYGNKIYNGLKQLLSSGRYEGGNLSDVVLDSFDFGGNYPSLGILQDENGNFSALSDYFLEDGSYLRLKNVTLGYTLPKGMMRALGVPTSSIRLYFSADNLLTVTNYSGIDPEVGYFGVDRGSYPVTRIYNLGININF